MTKDSEAGDVIAFIDRVENDGRREDSRRLLELMREVTGEEPQLWSGSMVGFGTYHYRYASGREGEYFKVGFAPRKANLTIYLMSGFDGHDDLLARLGPHTTGKSCLYVKRLDDIDTKTLTELVQRSMAHLDRVWGDS